jgi:hypothetical protein
MKQLIETTYVYDIDNEEEAAATVAQYKDEQLTKGYTVEKTQITHKIKKPTKKTAGEEKWITKVTIAYE